MITKEMYLFLKNIPIWPDNIPFDELSSKKPGDMFLSLHLGMAAKQEGLIGFNGKDENEGVYLSEKGHEAIEAYERQKSSDAKATWALIISFVSIIVAVVGWFFPKA